MTDNLTVNKSHLKIHKLLTDAGIPYVIIKGLASGLYYPDFLLRSMGDVDFLISENDVEKAFRACFSKFKVGALAVTDGKNPAFIAENGKEIDSLPVPVVENPVNPIGSGDTCSGVMLSEIVSGSSLREAFCCGLAAASANCLTEDPATFDCAIAKRFLIN